jgi:hypothetical protein
LSLQGIDTDNVIFLGTGSTFFFSDSFSGFCIGFDSCSLISFKFLEFSSSRFKLQLCYGFSLMMADYSAIDARHAAHGGDDSDEGNKGGSSHF